MKAVTKFIDTLLESRFNAIIDHVEATLDKHKELMNFH